VFRGYLFSEAQSCDTLVPKNLADETERGRTAATVQLILLRREGNHDPYVDMGYTPRIENAKTGAVTWSSGYAVTSSSKGP
jgi:hypothetical protein